MPQDIQDIIDSLDTVPGTALTGERENSAADRPEGPAVAMPERRRAKKRLPWLRIIVIAAASAVVLFAFLWEAFYVPRMESDRLLHENYPPQGRSEIQDELNLLDWVDQEFLPVNEFSRPGTPAGEITGIVIHYIGNPGTTAMQNRNYFANLSATGERHASSNFIVCLDGTVVQCVPVDEIAYASVDRNIDTVSIELCHPDETGSFTDETLSSAVRLAAWLCARYGITGDDIIRHYDITGKECPKYFVENEDEWEAFKDAVTAVIETDGAVSSG